MYVNNSMYVILKYFENLYFLQWMLNAEQFYVKAA